MRVVARQRQRLQGIVKPLRLAKLNAREDAAEQEDSQVGAQRDPSVGWDRALRPKGESSTTQRAGALPLTLQKHAGPFFLCSWSTPISAEACCLLARGAAPSELTKARLCSAGYDGERASCTSTR